MKPLLRAPIVAILIFQVAALFARAYVEIRLIEGGNSRPFAHDLSYLLVPPILIALMYPILQQRWQYLLSLLRRQDLTLRLLVMSVLLGISLKLTYWGGLISLVSFGAIRNSDPDAVVGPDISFGCPEPMVLGLSFLVATILTPIVEEVINRGLILNSLVHRGKIRAVLVSSLLFAIMHAPQAMALAFFVGIFLAVQMFNYRTFWATMITHATYNAMTVLDWECMSTQWNPITTTPSMVGTGFVASALAIVGLLFSIFLVQRNKHRDA
jgi:membrane protease YdiL (CAAX protease family)